MCAPLQDKPTQISVCVSAHKIRFSKQVETKVQCRAKMNTEIALNKHTTCLVARHKLHCDCICATASVHHMKGPLCF